MPCRAGLTLSNLDPRTLLTSNLEARGWGAASLGIDNAMFYFCPYPPSTQARYDLLQVQYLAPSQWFQPVARAYTFLTTHTHTRIHAHMHTPQRTRQRPPFFSKAAAHTDLSAAKPPPFCVEKEQRRRQEYLQEDRRRSSSSNRAGGGSVRWAGVRNTADGGGQAACLFCVLVRTAMSLRVSTHTQTLTRTHTHTHRDTCDATKGNNRRLPR